MSKRTARKLKHKIKDKTLVELTESPHNVSDYNEIYYEQKSRVISFDCEKK